MRERQEQRPRRSEPKKKYSVFVVDDDSDIAFSLGKGLEQHGFKVDSYVDPQTALSKFKAGLYDIALIDIKMPQMNGFEFYRKITKVDAKIKCCFMTAYEVYYETLKKDYPTLNVGCFFKKPVEPDYLSNVLKAELQPKGYNNNISDEIKRKKYANPKVHSQKTKLYWQ